MVTNMSMIKGIFHTLCLVTVDYRSDLWVMDSDLNQKLISGGLQKMLSSASRPQRIDERHQLNSRQSYQADYATLLVL